MTPSTHSPPGGSASGCLSALPTRLTGSWLIMAHAMWLALVTFSLGLFLAGLPVFYAQLQHACIDAATCNLVGALTTKGRQELSTSGLSVGGYAALITIFWALIIVVWSGIGCLLFWRRSDDWFALLAVCALVLFNSTYPGLSASALAFVHPAFSMPLGVVSFLGQLSLSLFFLLFPNGRVTPRWVRLVIPLIILQAVSFVVPPPSPFSQTTWPTWLTGVLALTIYGSTIAAKIYRYRRVSTALERQQTKWVVFGMVTVAGGFMVLALLFNGVFSGLSEPNTPSASLLSFAYPLLLLCLPLSIGAAILRYRLYDIDLLITRTLVYGLLSGMLGALYAGLIIGLESLAGLFGGQGATNPVVLVVSTLVIAALFLPGRRRVQASIDRRFYRKKYDAAKTLEAFSATLRQETDLEQIREHLLAVVNETMQPAHVSLWLHQPKRRSTEQAQQAHRLDLPDQAPTRPSSD